MLCNMEEDSRKKCECYWPTTINETKQFQNEIEITLEKEEWIIKNSIIKREFILKIKSEERRFLQFQVINWPDHSPPEEENGFTTINYVCSLLNEQQQSKTQKSPILLHCSAGTGRTGTIIAIANILKCFNLIKQWNTLSEIKVLPFFSVFNVVRKLREQRIGMVSSYSQYRYIYEFCGEWIKRYFDNHSLEM
jgi:protein tyrosine phosphatase